MSWFKGVRGQPWRITVAAVGGLLVAIAVAGMLGLLLNQNIERTASRALGDEFDLEDEGDDLRVAILDLRHFQRNISLAGPSRGGIEDFEAAYDRLHEEIDELEEVGVQDSDAPQPQEFREMARMYYEDFRPAIALYEEDRAAFTEASDQGLMRIDEMYAAAEEIEGLGEQLSQESLQDVDRAASTATLVLLAAVGGLLLAGAVLAYSTVRVLNEQRQLYAEQRSAAQKLADSSRAKTEFLADASHELRTPLTVLRGNAELGLTLDREWPHRDLLQEIVGESSRMTEMVEDLLFLARSDSAAPVEMALVSVADFFEEVASRAEGLARERGVELQTGLLHGEGRFEMDRRRLAQAVLILVDNATKYGARTSDGKDGTITLSSYPTAEELLIEVADEGPGIPEEELPKIFERFYRLDKARSRSMGGTGLGLPIARTIVQAHGGSIEADSTLGEGTLMRIRLPAPARAPVAE